MPMSELNDVRDGFCGLDDLPVLPGIAIRILEKIRDPKASIHQLAEILATDPPLSAKVLHVVNSPFFGLPNKIGNLHHAINLLGEESLKYIALSFSLIHLFDRKKSRLDYTQFWRESLTCAVISRLLAKALRLPDAEDFYFLGLIHNIGMLVLAQSHPLEYARVLEKTSGKRECHEAENAIFGFNHMQVGAFLMDSWGLPEKFTLPILYHHDPQRIAPDDRETRCRIRIILLAVKICQFLHREEKTLRLQQIQELLEVYEMADRVRLDLLFELVSGQIESLLPLFALDGFKKIDCIRILEESKKELVNVSSNLTRQVKRQQQTIDSLAVLASRDGLTKLKNYNSFMEDLDAEILNCQRSGHSSVLAVADLDSFKAVNDNYGHMAGDRVLQEVSRFFSENIRMSDVVARYGGEEFVFILSGTSFDNGMAILDRLRENLARMVIAFEGGRISVTMSVGVTRIAPDALISRNQLIRQADSAMYIAKNAGGNRIAAYGQQ